MDDAWKERDSSSSFPSDDDDNGYKINMSTKNESTQDNIKNKHHLPWISGGDGPVFGIHCNLNNDEFLKEKNTLVDGDDLWQSQPSNSVDNFLHGGNHKIPTKRQPGTNSHTNYSQQPHLRAICRYGNDVADMWRCISLAIHISNILSSSKSNNLQCAIECWDVNDGHILLIEAAENLPSWVDDDVLQGGVGGPEGCRNRCWLMNGKVHLIPPSSGNAVDSASMDSNDATQLNQRDALKTLMESSQKGLGGSITIASDDVQRAIENRLYRTSYKLQTKRQIGSEANKTDPLISPHWHVAAVALPATVARFLQEHPFLAPLLVDSFCKYAPKYLKERTPQKKKAASKPNNDSLAEADKNEEQRAASENDNSKSSHNVQSQDRKSLQQPSHNKHRESTKTAKLGQHFPYEQIVILPIILTRTTYAELVTGRGCVPSFPLPGEYRSVELNRFQRQLRQSVFEEPVTGNGGTPTRGNRFQRAVDVGVRLCAGLDWIIASGDASNKALHSKNETIFIEEEDAAIKALGEVERRLRVYWTRIDAEASRAFISGGDTTTSSLPWIENAWQAGPNGNCNQRGECDKVLLHSLQHMSKCPVFHPELSKPTWAEPCPVTRPGISLHEITKSGLKLALKWMRENYQEDFFPMPRSWEVDDDGWMEVNSLEELDAEMRNLSSSKMNDESKSNSSTHKPRRTTKRSRRKIPLSNSDTCAEGGDDVELNAGSSSNKNQHEDVDSLNTMLDGFRSFVEGEGELEGAVTSKTEKIPSSSFSQSKRTLNNPDSLMSQEVNINPRVFMNLLHSILRGKSNPRANENLSHSKEVVNIQYDHDEKHDSMDQDISKFFFEEDIDDGSINDGSDSSDGNNVGDSNNPFEPDSTLTPNADPWSLKNIMVSILR